MTDFDWTMPEQTALKVTIFTFDQNGAIFDLTGCNLAWTVYDGSNTQKAQKDTLTDTLLFNDALGMVELSEDVSSGNVLHFATLDAMHNAAFFSGEPITISDDNNSETNEVFSIDIVAKTITLANPLANAYTTAANAKVVGVISSFYFTLLSMETVLPSNKIYGVPVIWHHEAHIIQATDPSPQNPSGYPNKYLAVKGKISIMPILDTKKAQ